MENIKNIIAKSDSYRIFEDAHELLRVWSHNSVVWSWGAHAWKLYERKFLRFTVNGHLHKGHVWVMVNGNDLFDVYLTSSQGNIKQVITQVYLDELTNIIDINVEKIGLYKY